ncbi:heme oxygenase (staphylobilin-producing) [Salsuginibacillus halophilus]|uniref:Heme oxygenase (Staphylobilin-producing) n=1 Tax=Salsuginibacillus halophilus TaxID=517424 RepID=A0A2P8HG75_9BACI|nr:antibiotic biosynthesis monooxygenase [Salsuginibacillus halophilus]PSL45213.1 heme oxygenase (staphylobilin-producing) [Salsuginibacillus halophilus]
MYVVMNELHVDDAEGKEQMKARFSKSADSMANVDGCLEFMFLDDDKSDQKLVVFTKWEDKASYEAWLHSDAFKKAHQEKRESKEKGPSSSSELHAYEVVFHTS